MFYETLGQQEGYEAGFQIEPSRIVAVPDMSAQWTE